jgi:hypothetical protein
MCLLLLFTAGSEDCVQRQQGQQHRTHHSSYQLCFQELSCGGTAAAAAAGAAVLQG